MLPDANKEIERLNTKPNVRVPYTPGQLPGLFGLILPPILSNPHVERLNAEDIRATAGSNWKGLAENWGTEMLWLMKDTVRQGKNLDHHAQEKAVGPVVKEAFSGLWIMDVKPRESPSSLFSFTSGFTQPCRAACTPQRARQEFPTHPSLALGRQH